MATAFYSSKTRSGSGIQPRTPLGICSVSATYELTAALVINDTIDMVKVPAGATILDVILACDDLDTATSLTLSVIDDQISPFTYITASTIGQTGGVARADALDPAQAALSADTTFKIKAAAAPGSGTSTGTLGLTVLYTMDA